MKYFLILAFSLSIFSCGGSGRSDNSGKINWNTNDYTLDIDKSDSFVTLTISEKEYSSLKKEGIYKNKLSEILSQRLLNKFNDVFSHILIINNEKKQTNNNLYVGRHVSVLNNTSGIGRSIFDNSIKYGSNSTLESIIHLVSLEGFTKFNIFNHEFTHRYGNYYFPTKSDGHYMFSVGGILGGYKADSLRYIGDNIYEAEFPKLSFNRKFSYFDLYLMGLAYKEEVPLFQIARCLPNNGKNCPYWINESLSSRKMFYADYFDNISIDELILKHGERKPAYDINKMKTFRGMVVIVGSTPIDETFRSKLLKTIKFQTSPSFDNDPRINFFEATRGRAFLKWDNLSSELK